MSLKTALFTFICCCYFPLYAQIGLEEAGPMAVGYFQDAETALLQRDYKKAARLFEKCLKLQPNLTAAHRGLGACNELLKDYEGAVAEYEAVVKADSLFSRLVYYQLAEAHYKLGHYDQALKYFKEYDRLQQRPAEDFGLQGEREIMQEPRLVAKLPGVIKACEVSIDSLKFLNITEVFNMGSGVNSKADDYFPFLSNDQQIMYFTRRKNASDEDLYICRKEGGEWRNSQPVHDFNTHENEGMSTFVRDGRRMFFTACGRSGVMGTCDIWTADVDTEQNVTEVQSIREGANSESWDSQASISCDGSTLYFASNRLGGIGGTDIWVCKRKLDGTWGSPVNLGPKINTPEDEEAPFITNDGKTLYFSSTGHLGMGEQDIFMSWLDVRNNQWSTPINLGPPVNTAYRELGFFLSADGKTGYFASDRPGGSGGMDIYRFALSDKLFSDPISFVEGYIRDSVLMTPVKSAVAVLGRHTIETGDDGRFFLCVPADETLDLTVKQRGFKPYNNQFVIPEWNNRTFYTIELLLQPTISFIGLTPSSEKKDTVATAVPLEKQKIKKDVRHIVFFQFDKSNMEAEELERLYDFAKSLDNAEILRVEIIGFADDIGTEVYNLKLSEERAKNIALFLVQNKIMVDQIYLEGKGELKNEDPKSRNRRVEVKVTILE